MSKAAAINDRGHQMSEKQVIFCDTVQSAGVHNGIARISFIRLDAEGKNLPALELLIPVGEPSLLSDTSYAAPASVRDLRRLNEICVAGNCNALRRTTVTRFFKKRKTPAPRASMEPPAELKAAAFRSEESHSAQTAADACEPAAPAAPWTAEEPMASEGEAQSADLMLHGLAASLIVEGGFHFAPSQAALDAQSRARKVESITLGDDSRSRPVLKLTGGDQSAASLGYTEGFSIRVPDDFERQASEHAVRVRVLVRSAEAAPTRLAIAYSTNEVGNSGWQWRDVGANWAICELVWKVPTMIDGRGDFIGLLPDAPGAPGVEVHSLSATVV